MAKEARRSGRPNTAPMRSKYSVSRCSATAFISSGMPLLDHAEDHAARILRPNFLSDRNDRVFSRHSSAKCHALRPVETTSARERTTSRASDRTAGLDEDIADLGET